MDEPITCAGELEELALALELEVEALAVLQLDRALELIRSSFTTGDFGALSRTEAVRRVAHQCWGSVTVAERGQEGFLWGGSIAEAVSTPEFKVETATSVHGEWQGGARLADAGLPPKATESKTDKVTR